ncbi:MAG: ATP-binding protein [Bacteroidales bacterium]|nr:ATP-binding protein [Bacteroidales bacterium]MDD3527313.1 ATP-binding protein [Bacteroidales bacterium]MDD4175687.1 ATP-binding protein [Bacteroidales bacterium]MDY0335489.1 ATP-binding protein [Bacteroidales bacterium]
MQKNKAMYLRSLRDKIEKRIGSGKVIIVIGPRQVGKTTLIESILKTKDYLLLDGDDPKTRTLLSASNTEQIRSILGNNQFVFIDEAQRIDGIGLTMKIITDKFKEVQLFASGSSSFDLSNKINEPLTGRKWEYQLFPISWEEYENHHGYLYSEQQLENRLLYGFYPDVLNNPGDEIPILRNLVSSYLYKDILSFADLRKPEVLDKLVQALALQLGSEVSYSELAQIVNVDKNTISKYIDILQKGYIIFRLGSFSRNIRNEIKTSNKIYFYDNGVRNMIVGNFSPLEIRSDKNALWENFLISERVKQIEYKQSLARIYFWRTKQLQEVDFVEEESNKITGFEFKWKKKTNVRLPKSFTETYDAESRIIDVENFREFVVIKQ